MLLRPEILLGIQGLLPAHLLAGIGGHSAHAMIASSVLLAMYSPWLIGWPFRMNRE